MQTDLSTCFPLRPARMHEASGPGAAAFAAIAAAMSQGNLLWVREGWRPERINPVGLSGFFDPSRLLLAEPSSQSDCLSVTEEALRAHCREMLTGYKQPKRIEFRDSLPKTPVGKILRRELR